MQVHNYLKKILDAPVYQVVQESPLTKAANISNRLQCEVFLKREDLQLGFSFKLRGAYNKISKLSEAEKKRGIIAFSAGNHAQGVALAASHLGIKSTIVMPITVPRIKVDAVKKYGGEVILHGDTLDESKAFTSKRAEETGAVFVPPFDDPDIIAGQGTIAMEIMKQLKKPPKAIFVPVGGGGLIAGIAAYMKALYPEVRIISVEPEDSACLKAAHEAKERVVLDQVGIFADGVQVKQIGYHPWQIVEHNVDDFITVTNDEICASIRDIFEDTRSISEPAGAVAFAGMKNYLQLHKELDEVVCIVSGANMNFDRLRYVAERALIGEHQEALLSVTIPEKPGSFLEFCKLLENNDITEFNYRYSDSTQAHVFVGLGINGDASMPRKLIDKLGSEGFSARDLTDNDLAKTHVRYMVGGRAGSLKNERLFRFEFPERPKALLDFLKKIGRRWNISLFHYRNHGSSHGRVLAGMEISKEDEGDFYKFLEELDYPFFEESDNKAYDFFLK